MRWVRSAVLSSDRSKLYYAFFAVLVIGLVGIAANLGISRVPFGWEGGEVNYCGRKKTYIEATALYKSEEKNFSSNALAYDVLTSQGKTLRIITDATAKNMRVALINNTADNLQEKNLALEAVLPDGQKVKLSGEKNLALAVGEQKIYLSEDITGLPPDGREATLTISSGEKCLTKILLAFQFGEAIQRNKPLVAANLVKAGEIGEIEIPPGDSVVGFSDWRLVKPFYEKNIKVLSFNRAKKNVFLESGSNDHFEPGIGYVLRNDSLEPKKVDLGVPFETPQDFPDHTLLPGWNLLYNDSGQDESARQLEVSCNLVGFTARDLILKNLVSSQSQQYFQDKLDQEKLQLASLDLSRDDAFVVDGTSYWLYVFDEKIKSQFLPKLELELKTDKDEYKPGEKILFTFTVTNKDSLSHFVTSGDENNLCQFGIQANDSGKTKIDDQLNSDLAKCVSWPKFVELRSGDKKEYNEEWKVPANASGNLDVLGYFDYSRLRIGNILTKQISVKVSNKQ